MRRLLLDWLFVGQRDGACLTRPYGWVGPWRRITAQQKQQLIELYLYAMQGSVLLAAFGLYRAFFGDSVGCEVLFSVAGFAFGASIFMTQAWLLGDAPDVSAPADGRANTVSFNPITVILSLATAAQPLAAVIAFLLAVTVLAAGLVLGETGLSIAGLAGVAVCLPLLRHMMLKLWRSRR